MSFSLSFIISFVSRMIFARKERKANYMPDGWRVCNNRVNCLAIAHPAIQLVTLYM